MAECRRKVTSGRKIVGANQILGLKLEWALFVSVQLHASETGMDRKGKV